MTPTDALQLAIATLLANDTTTLANAVALHVHLAKNAFTPSPGSVIADFTEADFVGYAVIDPTAGVQDVYLDPVTGLYTVQLKEPVGGWHFQTTGITNLPQSIYGWYVTDHTDAVLYGCGRLPSPIPLAVSGQGFDLPVLTFAFLGNSPQ